MPKSALRLVVRRRPLLEVIRCYKALPKTRFELCRVNYSILAPSLGSQIEETSCTYKDSGGTSGCGFKSKSADAQRLTTREDS